VTEIIVSLIFYNRRKTFNIKLFKQRYYFLDIFNLHNFERNVFDFKITILYVYWKKY